MTNRKSAGRLLRSVSQGVYIFILTEPLIHMLLMLFQGAVTLQACGSGIIGHHFHKYDFFMDIMRQSPCGENCSGIEYKLLINNIRSMEVNPFIRKLIAFFYRKGIFLLSR